MPFTLMKVLTDSEKNNTHTHSHKALCGLPLGTKHAMLKRKVRLNFLTNSFLSISKAIMDKVQGQLCTSFKRKCGRMRQRWHQNKTFLFGISQFINSWFWKRTGTDVKVKWDVSTADWENSVDIWHGYYVRDISCICWEVNINLNM